LLAAARVFLELLARQPVHDQVAVPMGRDFMSHGCHFARQFRTTLRQAPQRKKCCVHMVPLEQLQQEIHLPEDVLLRRR
jgi:hypothetical protein